MFERNVYDVYGLYCESRFFVGEYEGFQAGDTSYILLPKEDLLVSEQEMLLFIDYLHSIGDSSVLEPIQTVKKQTSGLIDGQRVYVCPISTKDEQPLLRGEDAGSLGEHLATIHYYGKQVRMEQPGELFGNWHKLWEVRLEQLESWYEQILYEKPQTFVDEAFLFSFPYYMGLTENAIQYIVDAMIDHPDSQLEQPTICHRRFTDETWLRLSEDGQIAKRPTEFVYDHPCRDLAEWIRHKRDSQSLEDIQLFLNGYEQYEPLTPYSWRMLYARLLFPLHYFEVIEHYYRSQVREMREEAGEMFFQLLKDERKNEQFLQVFMKDTLNTKGFSPQQLPEVDWL